MNMVIIELPYAVNYLDNDFQSIIDFSLLNPVCIAQTHSL